MKIMPSLEEKAIFRKVNYLKSKFNNVKEDAESVITLLQNCLLTFDQRIVECIESDSEGFPTLYRKLNTDIEDFQEKLFYILASVEVPTDYKQAPKSASLKDTHTVQLKETAVPLLHSSSVTLETPSIISPNINESCSVDQNTKVKSFYSSKFSSFASLNDVEDATCDIIKTPIADPAVSNSLHNVNQGASFASLDDVLNASYDTTKLSTADPEVTNSLCNANEGASFASVNDVLNVTCDITESSRADPVVTNSSCNVNEGVLVKSELVKQLIGSVTSIESLSQSSCYRSLSSNVSDFYYQSAASGPQTAESNISDISSIQSESQFNQNKSLTRKVISHPQIMLPLTSTATLAHIENPGNFWLQLEDMKTSAPCYPKEKYFQSFVPNSVKKGDFFLAPSKSMPFYLRVKILSDSQKDQSVKILFVDNGSLSTVQIKELRILPTEAYNIPMQAINCFLAEITAKNNIWCFAAIRKLKEFSSNSLEACFKTCDGEKYGVKLIATVSMFENDFSCDIGESLCNDGFAVENEPPEDTEDSTSMPVLCDNVQTSLNQINNQLSCDSGVSVTSNRQSSPNSQTKHYNSDVINVSDTISSINHQRAHNNEIKEYLSNDQFDSEVNVSLNRQPSLTNQTKHYNSDVINSLDAISQCSLNENVQSQEIKKIVSNNQTETNFGDLISFESNDDIGTEAIEYFEEPFNPFHINYIKCLKICTCECPLHLIIPLPSINFVAEDMVIVMLSHIVNPSEFYVNMAMESSITLDELHENMNVVYGTSSPEAFSILLDDLKEGTFCAAYFEDGNWYRVKVLSKHLKFDQSPNVYVQYVDYGNKAWIKNTDLRTLTNKFSRYPSFSVKCSLAGVVPAQSSDYSEGESLVWAEEAIETFRDMIGFEDCLTAQICDRRVILNDDPLQILLWDTQGKQDVLVNKTLVDTGLAKFDYSILQKLFDQVKKPADVEILNHWDPMKDEYNDVQNSYGVNVDDFEVAINGYKHNDEEYICKYFSLRGHCPRLNCPFEHVSLGEGGVTRDREELYSFHSHPPLPISDTHIFLHVCAVISPGHFYAHLPFGNRTVDELDSLINKGVSKENLQDQEVYALFQALNDHYDNKPFDEKTTLALSYGSIVVAKRQYDQTWHRARIVDVQDVAGPAKVFYVDFGNEEWVERRNVRQIQPQFLHTPFQAVECSLCDVEPLGFENGEKWSIHALSCFKNLVSETTMLAYVAGICNDVLQVSLRRTTETDHRTVKDHLIREGFAQDKPPVKKRKPQTKYVPG